MPRKENISKDELRIAEEEYKYAITLMQYATQLLSQQFSAFMLAETVIIGFLGNALRDGNKLVLGKNSWVFVGAIIGLVICLFWYSTFVYNHKLYILRMEQAKRHEAKLRLSLFAEGKEESDKVAGKLLGLRPFPSMIWLIYIFSGIFIFLIIFTQPWQ